MGRGDLEEAKRQIAAWRSVADEVGLGPLWNHLIQMTLGWCQAHTGQVEEGITAVREGLNEAMARGVTTWLPYFSILLAEVLALGGKAAEGVGLMKEAIARVNENEDRCHESVVYRVLGELHLDLPDPQPVEAEVALRRAIEVAQRQEAKSYELRATTGLARLLQGQGRAEEGRTLLEEVYGWFSEGFDTADLVKARRTLERPG